MADVILSSGRRGRAPSPAAWRSAASSAVRGVALVGVAVLIGIVLLQVVDDGTTGPIGDGAGAPTAPATTTTTGPGPTTTTKPPGEVRPPQQVTVVVLNGSGRPGAATAQTNALKAKGYQTGTPADATRRQGTIIYYRSGFEREAAALATAVGGNPKVEPMPETPPPGTEDADCVVILGL